MKKSCLVLVLFCAMFFFAACGEVEKNVYDYPDSSNQPGENDSDNSAKTEDDSGTDDADSSDEDADATDSEPTDDTDLQSDEDADTAEPELSEAEKCLAAGGTWALNGSESGCIKITECDPITVENAEWNGAYYYARIYTDGEWSEEIHSEYSEEAGTCKYKCKPNYNYENNSCVAKKQTVTCEIPANAINNSATEIEQTWNGTAWLPSEQGTYNLEASETECRFVCNENYKWNGSECVANPCAANPCASDANSNGKCYTDGTNYVCGCNANFGWNGSACSSDVHVGTCTGLIANAEWNSVPIISQTWNGTDWTPSLVANYSEEASTAECRFQCKANYKYEDGQCLAEKQTVTCEIPANAINNSATEIMQTWNGSAWLPSEKGSYNIEASTTECRFICNENYEWNGSECVANPCATDPCASDENSNGKCYTDGTNYVCGCNENFGWNGSACSSDVHVGTCTGLIANAEWNSVPIISQTWNGTEWTPSLIASYSDDASTEKCYFKCASGYTWNGSQCVIPECSSSSGTPCKDSSSGLIWSAKASSTYPWQNALIYCDIYSEGGLSGWHLPTISELRTLIKNCSDTQMPGGSCGVTDICLSESCWTETTCYPSSCDFDSTGRYSKFGDAGWFWSSSAISEDSHGAWKVSFSFGYVGEGYTPINYYFRCVRNAD